MNIGKFRVPLALLGYFFIIANLTLNLIPGFLKAVEHTLSHWAAGFVVAMVFGFLWMMVFTAVFIPLAPLVETPGASRRQALFRIATAFALGWPLAWVCMVPHEADRTGGSMLTTFFFLAWNFAGAICLAQEMPKFRVHFHVPVRFSAI